MKSSILTFLLSLILGATLAHGAVITVPSESDLNSSISAASSGDTLVLMGGFYGNIVVNGKALHFRHTQVIPQVDSISFINANGDCSVTDFKIDGDCNASNASLSLFDCEILGSVNLNSTSASTVTIRNTSVSGNLISTNQRDSKLNLIDSNVTGNMVISKCNLVVKGSKVTGNLSNNPSIDNVGAKLRSIILQSEIGQKLEVTSARSFVYYNLIRYSYFEGNAEIVGNDLNGRTSHFIGIDVNGTNSEVLIKNNRIHGYNKSAGIHIQEKNIGIRISNMARAEIVNNLIYSISDGTSGGNENYSVLGIYVKSTNGTKILGNIFWNISTPYNTTTSARAIIAPYGKVISQNNCFDTRNSNMHNTPTYGGILDQESITGIDPKFTDLANGDFTLASDSPCINAGPPDPQYNDRDGSRNDIGMFGGHNFIPDGRTTDKPIVLGLDIAPIAVPTGGTVTIESTGATVK
ncbi:hypothetical protein N9H45_05325 [Opitutales bacterium]|nr:hypothetical protein [Opitutales bacterium]